MTNSIKTAQSQAGLDFAHTADSRPTALNRAKKFILTLLALLTISTGAWAADYYVVGNFNNWSTNPAYKMTLNTECTSTTEYILTLDLAADAQFKVVKVEDEAMIWYPDGMENNYGENGELKGAGKYTVYFRPNGDGNQDWFYGVINVAAAESAPASIITINEAKTEASFQMPQYDVTATYELVRDLAQQVTFGGIPTGDGLVVKNNGTAYEFATTPDFTLTDALADNADIISAEGITITVGKMVEVEGFEGHRQFDEATAVSLADFLANPQPGIYKMKATATADGTYDGTIYSADFTLVEKYDLAIQPADDYSKGKLSEVTVAGAAQTLDADGKATTTADPNAEVKLKAKHGYVIEKVEAKKIVPAEGHDLTASAVGDIVGSDGKTYAAADKDNLPKNVTAVAMVAYKNGTGGLAIALSDEGSMNFSTAKSTCESKTAISGATWLLPSKNQWEQIFSANGGNNNSCTGLNTAIDNAGGTALVAGNVYWTTSSAIVSGSHYCLIINTGGSITSQIGSSGNNKMTRAILTF